MKKVNFYKITGPLPAFDSKYEGLFVFTTNDNKLFLGVNGSWSELTNNETLDIIEQNERVVATALCDLDNRISSMSDDTEQLKEIIHADEMTTAAALNDLNEKIYNLSEVNESDLNDLNEKIYNLSDTMKKKEEVTAASLNDLNKRIDHMNAEIINISRKLDELMNNSGV